MFKVGDRVKSTTDKIGNGVGSVGTVVLAFYCGFPYQYNVIFDDYPFNKWDGVTMPQYQSEAHAYGGWAVRTDEIAHVCGR